MAVLPFNASYPNADMRPCTALVLKHHHVVGNKSLLSEITISIIIELPFNVTSLSAAIHISSCSSNSLPKGESRSNRESKSQLIALRLI